MAEYYLVCSMMRTGERLLTAAEGSIVEEQSIDPATLFWRQRFDG